MSSFRRVKKGPGRRPQSAKRQRFMELRERGWSILAAAREVGVSRTTGNNWSRGYKTYRHRPGRRVRLCAGAAGRATDQPEVPVAGRADRDRRSAPRGSEHPSRSRTGWVGRPRRSRGSCAATRPERGLPSLRGPPAGDRAPGPRASATHRDQRRAAAAGRRAVGQRWSPQQISRELAGEVPRGGRRVAVSREHLPGRSISQDRAPLRPSRLAPHLARRCAPAAITGGPSSAPNAVGQGLSTRCSPSTNGRSRPRTAPRPGHWEGDLSR